MSVTNLFGCPKHVDSFFDNYSSLKSDTGIDMAAEETLYMPLRVYNRFHEKSILFVRLFSHAPKCNLGLFLLCALDLCDTLIDASQGYIVAKKLSSVAFFGIIFC